MSALRFGSFANMELTFIWVTALASVVSATPHGYGVKGGAAAKADASAGASAYSGGFPLAGSVPLSGGFSGSYSKSSASSFASSSASSSSSSFSFSGSGLSGIPVTGGCSTGICPHSGSSTVNGNTDTFKLNSAANTAAAAGAQVGSLAGSYPSSSCAGNNCDKSPNCNKNNCGQISGTEDKCESGACQPGSSNSRSTDDCATGVCKSDLNSQTKTNNFGPKGPLNVAQDRSEEKSPTSSGNSPQNCVSGNCGDVPYGQAPGQKASQPLLGNNSPPSSDGSTFSKEPLPHKYDSDDNDIPINKASTATSYAKYDTEDQTSKDDTLGINTSGCVGGKCGPSPGFGSTPTYSSGVTNINPTDDFKPNLPKCYSPNCNNEFYNPHEAASSRATIPSYDKPSTYLTTPNHEPCTAPNCGNSGTNPGQHPSSSGVPFLNTHSTTSVGTKCNGGNCDNHPSGPNSLKNYPKTEYESPSTCISPHCAPSSQNTPYTPSSSINSFPRTTSPAFGSSYHPISHSQSSSVPGTHSSAPSVGYNPNYPSQSSSAGFPSPQQNTYNTGYKTPNSQGFPYYNMPNEGLIPAHIPLNSANCVNGNCAEVMPKPNHELSLGSAGTVSGHIPSGPSNCVNGNCEGVSPSKSSYGPSSGSTGSALTHVPFSPSNCVNGNCAGVSPFKPSYGQSSGSTIPSSDYAPLSPPNCVNGNCAGNSPSRPSFETSAGSTVLNTGGVPSTSSNCLNGKCDGISFTKPVSPGATHPNYNLAGHPSGSPGTTATNHLLTPHSSQDAGTNSVPGHSNGLVKPEIPSEKNKPAYTGGFGGPSGLLKPNDFSIPSNAPTSYNNPSTTGHFDSVACSAGKCNTQGQATGSQNGASEAHFPTSCKTGNCGSNTQTGTTLLSSGYAGAGAVASANAVAYSGGFGGPPGLLKPFDDGKAGKSISDGLIHEKHPFSSQLGSSQNKNLQHANRGIGEAGATAQAVAIAGATAGAFGGHYTPDANNGGHKTSNGCGGGCPGNGPNGDISKFGLGGSLNGALSAAGAEAKAGAVSGAGAQGFSGSFASSSASAHASSGAAVKGGYGRR